MPRRSLLAIVFSCAVLAAASPAYAASVPAELLIRVERRAADDLAVLAGAGLPVVLETVTSLYLEGTVEDLAAAARLGFSVAVIDREADGSDYLHLGIRPDTDLDAVRRSGTQVWAEDNWRLVRVARGEAPERLLSARVHQARLSHDPVRVAEAAAAPASAAYVEGSCGPHDPIVAKIVAGVDSAAIDAYWRALTTNPPTGTRYSTSAGCADAVDYVESQMHAAGVAATRQSFRETHAPNVVGTHPGAVHPERSYLVVGHLDDLPVWGLAPGANDNAAGAVTVLEAARATSCWAFRSTLKYLAVAGEEAGLLGSDFYAADALAHGEDIGGVLNLDMNGWQGDGLPGPENLDLNYNAASQSLGVLFADCAARYATGVIVDAFLCPTQTSSDHYSFWRRGYQAVSGVTDNEGYCGHGGHYPNYHQRSDNIPACGDPAFFQGTIRATVATLATLAEPFKIAVESAAIPAQEGVVRVIVGDRDLDRAADQVESVAVEMWSDAEPVPESILLTERSAHSMLFSAEVATTADATIAGDGRISVTPGGAVHARYVDARDCDGAAGVEYVASMTVGPPPRPGEVGALTVAVDGATTRIEWEVVSGAAAYDLAGGRISELRADAAWGRAACLANDLLANAWTDPRQDLAAGEAHYYLVRAQGVGGSGTWGSSSGGAERELISACP